MKITVLILSVLMSLCFMLTGCGGGSQAVNAPDENAFANIVDDEGNTVVLREKPQRIVVLSASFLEPLHEVGGDVVGRPDSKTKMPDYAKNAESIGQVYQIDAEKVVSLKPDLVIANKGMNEKVAKLLNDNSIPTIVMDMKNYDSIKNELRVFAQVTGEGIITDTIADDALLRLEVDKAGLDHTDRRILESMIKKFGGGPVGLDTLAASTSEERDTIEDVYEPYLLQLGFINRTAKGRVVTPAGYDHMNIPYPGAL